MHNAAAEVTKLKADEYVACACEYQEGACKKETTTESGCYRCYLLGSQTMCFDKSNGVVILTSLYVSHVVNQ